jgi:hypothetical protein
MEELAALVLIKASRMAAYLYTSLQITLKTYHLTANNMSALTTDGAFSQKRRNYSDDRQDAEESGNSYIMTFLCMLHQETLCVRPFPRFQYVMSIVTKVVNFIRSRGLNHRQFQNLLSELEAQRDLVCYSEVRLLSPSKMPKLVFNLRR